jgi:hypothetical protein
MYPDFVKAVMPVGGASATDGPGGAIAAWTFQLAKASLESDPVWIETKADYYKLPKDKHPNQGVEFHWSQLLLTGYDLSFRQAMGWDEVSKGRVRVEARPAAGQEHRRHPVAHGRPVRRGRPVVPRHRGRAA